MDLKEVEVHVAFGELGKGNHLGHGGEKIRFANAVIERGLSTHPGDNQPSMVAYAVNRRFTSLHGRVGVNDSAFGGAKSPLVFEIHGDGLSLWRSRPITRNGDAAWFHVDVKQFGRLELRVRCLGTPHSAHAIWLDPFLLR